MSILMSSNSKIKVDIALIHYPVINKLGETIGSAVTNLDIHDIARASATYGVDNYFIVTPYEDQHELVTEITAHWQKGYGATYNPSRKRALDMVKLSSSIEDTIEQVTEFRGQQPLLVTTSAIQQSNSLNFSSCRTKIEEGQPLLLLFGTAHGLAPEIMAMADINLPPVRGRTEYNHLSVRSAVSIILDRLLGVRE